MNKIQIDNTWTLFLDRDGVINRRLPGAYVSDPSEFEFLPGVLESMAWFSAHFLHLIIVTNQQGIAKGLMSTDQLITVHEHMMAEISLAGGYIDGVFVCGDLADDPGNCRKPSPVMAFQAQKNSPDIDFDKSIMIGDSMADVAFGQNLGMVAVLVGEHLGYPDPDGGHIPDFILEDLTELRLVLEF